MNLRIRASHMGKDYLRPVLARKGTVAELTKNDIGSGDDGLLQNPFAGS